MDANCTDYVAFAASCPTPAVTQATATPAARPTTDGMSELQTAIVQGRVEMAGQLTEQMLRQIEPLTVVQDEIIPALDRVGKGFEEKTVYLPQLLMSAEAAKRAFSHVKEQMLTAQDPQATKGKIVIATVHGDIHDIGKNIVRLLLENYGFEVIDLGKDVPPETIAEAVVREHVPLMETTIRKLRADAPWCRVMVGGAVLNPEYAARIGADRYCKDAMEAVRYAETLS